MKKFIYLILLTVVSCLVNNQRSEAQASGFPEKDGLKFSPRWVDNLVFLKGMGDGISAEKQMLYKWAEAKLAIPGDSSFSWLGRNAQFQDFCTENKINHLGGPLLGNISDTSVDVWVRTRKPDSIRVVLTVDGLERSFGPTVTSYDTDLSGVVRIEGLLPNQAYPYRVFVGDSEIPQPKSARIRTTDHSLQSTTTIGFGSCFHRWGLGNKAMINTILDRKPHAFVGLGDIVAQDKLNHIGWHTLDYLSRDLYPAWNRLVASVPFYALWDDHDYFGNDLAGIPKGYSDEDRQRVWKVFKNSWNNPSYGFEDAGKGVFFRSRVGVVDLIVLDHRYFRTEDSFLGEAQMDWLERQLLDCKGPFIVLACGTMWSDAVSKGKDSWGAVDPEGRERIFRLIEQHNIKGVVFISGDRHGSRVFRIPRPSGHEFYEFEVASLGGLAGPPASLKEWKDQLFGLSGGYAFGEFVFDTTQAEATLTFNLVTDSGNVLHSISLTHNDLTPKK
ncbi:MAG: alkaline phosphatase D family protein [Bacteroidota bacterium]